MKKVIPILCFMLSFHTLAHASWTVSTVDTAIIGGYTSIATDTNNRVYIAYEDWNNKDIKYATNVSGSFVLTTVDGPGDVGRWSSLALDTANSAYVSYYDYTNKVLKYATNATGSWVIAVVDSSADVGISSSIAVDSAGHAHIAYFDNTNKKVKYATNAGGSWVTTTIDNAENTGARNISLALDSNGNSYIAYYYWLNPTAYIRYATNASGSWITTTVSNDVVGGGSSIKLDSLNYIHIVYDNNSGSVKYLSNATGSWATTVIDSSAATEPAIAIDGNGKEHICYYTSNTHYLRYATNASGAWVATTADSTGGGADCSIVADTGNNVHISYVNAWTNSNLLYAHTTDTTPPTVTSTTPANNATGVAVSATVNATFSEAIDQTTLTTSTFTVSGATGTVSYNSLTKTATFTPSANLANSTTYTATLTTGIKDTAGNALALNYSWSFTTANTFTVTPSAGANGSISPSTPQTVNSNSTTAFTVTPGAGYTASVGGTCGGSLVGTTYTTSAITANCTVIASFTNANYTVTPSAGAGGSVSPSTSQTVGSGSTTTFTITTNTGYTASVGGTCGGSLSGTTYTTNAITADCTVIASFTVIPPPLPNCTYSLSTSSLSFSANGGTGSFNVNQNETSCANSGWTAASSSSWITITSGSSGNWSIQPVTFTVSANTTNAQRTGAITIPGQSNTATMAITQSALLILSPNALNYGTLKTAETATRSLTVTNTSGSSLTISGVNITGADSTDFTLTNNCNTLSNNGSCALDVKFAPTTAGSKTATLTITANSITFTVTLTGTADNNANSAINVNPSVITNYVDIEFGNGQVITISNPGTGTLLIQSIGFYGKDLYEFTVTGNCFIVLPQETCALTLTSAYTSNQAKEASLVITSNASNADKLEIPINMASQRCATGSISISPVSATASSDALTGALTVTAPDKCWWMASSNAAWISADTTNWFHGNGTVNYTVSANTGSTSRIGQIDVGGIPFTVIQNGASAAGIPNDISGHEFEDNINALYVSGITDTTANFYPDNTATKEDIAVFIIRALYGEDFTYTTTPYFSDVPVDHPYFKYVQKLKDDKITWAEGVYEVDTGVRRSWAAAFIIRAIYGETFSYPAAPYFSDVPVDHPYFKYIQKMKERGFTHASGEYSPDYLMPRDALAAFIAEGFLGMEH